MRHIATVPDENGILYLFETICLECKSKIEVTALSTTVDKAREEAMKKLWTKGWSPSCNICCNCFRGYQMEE